MLKFWGIMTLVLLLGWNAQAQMTAVVSEDEIADALKQEFVEQGVEDRLELEFFGGQTNFAFAGANQAKIMISKLKFDESQNKFSAMAEIFADGKPAAQTMLQGRFFVMAEAWVPASNIEKDTVITAAMLKPITVRSNRMKAVNVTDKDLLIDMQAKRGLKEGKLITDRDVGAVIVIKKGKLVTSSYNRKGMSITAKVEAQEDGAKGQNIAVVNIKSGKKFFARVVDGETVEIPAEQ